MTSTGQGLEEKLAWEVEEWAWEEEAGCGELTWMLWSGS
jgi:hypothetical protein